MGALVQHNYFCLKLPFEVWVLLELLFVDSAKSVKVFVFSDLAANPHLSVLSVFSALADACSYLVCVDKLFEVFHLAVSDLLYIFLLGFMSEHWNLTLIKPSIVLIPFVFVTVAGAAAF